jgi:HSP20 family protein
MEMPFTLGRDYYPRSMTMPLDLSERDDAWEVHADVPGISKEHLRVDVQHGMLTITAERKQNDISEGGKGDHKWRRVERSFGTASRAIRLPENVDEDNIKATCCNGQLYVTIPKKEPTKQSRRSIAVE